MLILKINHISILLSCQLVVLFEMKMFKKVGVSKWIPLFLGFVISTTLISFSSFFLLYVWISHGLLPTLSSYHYTFPKVYPTHHLGWFNHIIYRWPSNQTCMLGSLLDNWPIFNIDIAKYSKYDSIFQLSLLVSYLNELQHYLFVSKLETITPYLFFLPNTMKLSNHIFCLYFLLNNS